MAVRYIATEDPTDDRICTVFGETFEMGVWTEVADGVAVRLMGNPTFEVDGAPAPAPEDTESPDVDALRAQLDELGVDYRSNAGVKRLTELLDEATAPKG